jgi:hypothetical protein
VAFEMQSDKGKEGARVSAFNSFVTAAKSCHKQLNVVTSC